MPSEAPVCPTQPEKPHHYTYLKEFRTQQCPLFLQHKCTQHRPFTCFHWHFLNQRRRRPVRRRDGTFNYSPDIYCTKYDETTGICGDGDDCPFLHRTAGDTERRYHLRYYKTGTCVHETDTKGHCVKNGPHCAFAHGAHDLRTPVYDIRELQVVDVGDKTGLADGTPASQLEKDRMANEDPKWNDTNYVLANYKTEPCKRPPRLCRQGYACPSYHNTRDRRRSPKKYKYRSTPCPNVKHGDDWGDPTQCENGDGCPYCHTRTEQQFHPEIYKSTKCNDMVQTGYCPRGPFCAFAHVEQEMTTQREIAAASDNSLAAFVTNALPQSAKGLGENNGTDIKQESKFDENKEFNDVLKEQPATNGSIYFQAHLVNTVAKENNVNNHNANLPEPIGKKRSGSVSSNTGMDPVARMVAYQKAPGSEREDAQTKLRQQMQSIEDDITLDAAEKTKRKQNLLLLHNLNVAAPLAANVGSSIGSTPTTPSSTVSSTMSPHAPSFYPPGDTVESVIGNALDEDLNLGELSQTLSSMDLAKELENDANSVSSSYGTNFQPPQSYFGPSSLPVTIPSTGMQRNSLGSLSQSPISSPLGSFPTASATYVPQHVQQQQKQEQQLQDAATAFLSQPNPGKYSAPGYSDYNSMSPRSSVSQSPLLGSTFVAGGGTATPAPAASASGNNSVSGMNGFSEVQRLRNELALNKAQIAQWEEGIGQARNACDAWKKEAEEAARKAKIAEEERQQAFKQRDEALNQLAKLKQEVEQLRGGPFLHCLQRVSELDALPATILNSLQTKLRLDLDTLEKYTALKCMVCQERNRSIVALPCNHYVMCDQCATKRADCPFCHQQIAQRTSMVIPM